MEQQKQKKLCIFTRHSFWLLIPFNVWVMLYVVFKVYSKWYDAKGKCTCATSKSWNVSVVEEHGGSVTEALVILSFQTRPDIYLQLACSSWIKNNVTRTWQLKLNYLCARSNGPPALLTVVSLQKLSSHTRLPAEEEEQTFSLVFLPVCW